MNKLLDDIRGGKCFTRLHIKKGYNLIKIVAGGEWKTAFHTKEGPFAYEVMPFGLTNATASFQEIMSIIFLDMEECIWHL